MLRELPFLFCNTCVCCLNLCYLLMFAGFVMSFVFSCGLICIIYYLHMFHYVYVVFISMCFIMFICMCLIQVMYSFRIFCCDIQLYLFLLLNSCYVFISRVVLCYSVIFTCLLHVIYLLYVFKCVIFLFHIFFYICISCSKNLQLFCNLVAIVMRFVYL